MAFGSWALKAATARVTDGGSSPPWTMRVPGAMASIETRVDRHPPAAALTDATAASTRIPALRGRPPGADIQYLDTGVLMDCSRPIQGHLRRCRSSKAREDSIVAPPCIRLDRDQPIKTPVSRY